MIILVIKHDDEVDHHDIDASLQQQQNPSKKSNEINIEILMINSKKVLQGKTQLQSTITNLFVRQRSSLYLWEYGFWDGLEERRRSSESLLDEIQRDSFLL